MTSQSPTAASLAERIKNKQAVIGIVGMGYVGLPLALTFCKAGFRVMGIDIDTGKIAKLRKGESYIKHIDASKIAEAIQSGKLVAESDFAKSRECDALLMCVPTPLTKNREPDMTFVEGTARGLAPHVRAGQLFVLESTTYPGTTDELVLPILEGTTKQKAGRDFFLAFSPEREDPGNPNYGTKSIPKVVGGLTSTCRDLAAALYGAALDKVVPVSSTRVAEMTKLLENIFRSVNIALVNELKVVCERMNIDIWEVIDSAATKPFGYMPFYPGPGLGGHCIPIDPFYLTWKAREYELSTRFIELAGEVNTAMPNHVVERLAWALNERQRSVKGAKVLVLGAAYKRDIDDMRESPALRIMELLQLRGALVDYHDPFVPELRDPHHRTLNMKSKPLSNETLRASDAVLIITDHSTIDYAQVVREAPLVIDTRNATRKISGNLTNVVKA